MVLIGLEMHEMCAAQPDRLGDRRFFHMHVKGIQHQFDCRMIDCVKKFDGLLGRAKDVTFETIERLDC